ncbi:MAG TPA: acyltransferase family protein, partial [Rhodocyclaceae bacterium]|nr:acyltransferase family protein [Rhodocyclaceae bacterium]
RCDIQALRGYAVLIVLLYHAKLTLLPGGYLGVDIFFVISGFLITRLIKDGIEKSTFSFTDFYFRRAKRLLPAAYITFLATAALAPLFLTSAELKDFQIQVAGAVSFTGNFVLWKQSSYFSGAAELKPLLHVWSLAIEEQYYFILPAFLFFLPRRYWLSSVIAILLISLVMCIALAGRGFTFYLLPTRAWELLIGSVGALLLARPIYERVFTYLFWPALAALLVLPFVPPFSYHPGPEAFAVCVATLVILLRKHPLLQTHRISVYFSKLGDISYSLYLVHWPLFAFFNNAWIGKTGDDQPLSIRLALVVLSLVLAYLLNRYVEEPVRHLDIQRTRKIFLRTVATSFGIVLFNAGFANAVGDPNPTIRHANYGFAPTCAMEGAFSALKECRNSETPELIVWGDSFAMHLVSGLINNPASPKIVQATRPVCGPIQGLAVVREQGGRSREWAESCLAFNQAVLAYVKKTPSITTVVFSSPLDYYVSPKEHLLKLDSTTGRYSMVTSSVSEAVAGFKQTVDTLHALGKKVVFVSPPPMSGFDVGRCLDRQKSKLPIFGMVDGCNIDTAVYQRQRAPVIAFLDAVQAAGDVHVIRLDDELCTKDNCSTSRDGIPLYHDNGHLSVAGSIYLAKKISLLDQIKQTAR